jgi:CYTH domain-containing protein
MPTEIERKYLVSDDAWRAEVSRGAAAGLHVAELEGAPRVFVRSQRPDEGITGVEGGDPA